MAKTIKLSPSTLDITRIVVHQIPKHKKDQQDVQPRYSEQESILSDGLRSFFKEKIVQAFKGHNAYKIVYNDDSVSEVPALIVSTLLGNDFVENSKSMAKSLFGIQSGSNSAGILVVMYATVDSNNSCIVFKLEGDEGAQLAFDEKTKTISINEVKDLMLTKRTKIFKVALFVNREDFQCKYDGVTVDYQNSLKNKKDSSSFFIDDFLGCKPFKDPKIITKDFYNITKAYINTVEDPIKRTKYLEDLNSYVQKNVPRISATEYAEHYIAEAEEQDAYISFMKTKKFPVTSFVKDTIDIANKVQRLTVTFSNGISIVGEKGSFKKKVKLVPVEDGQTKAEIVSKIQKVE